MIDIAGKTALIGGASRAFGRAIADKFAKAGAKLVLPVYDWPDSISELKREYKERGIPAHIVQVDLRKKDDVKRLAQQIEEFSGSLDFLINNIERGGMPIVHGSYDHPHNSEQWQREIDTTLTAKWLVFHHCFPLIEKGGAVLNISSIAGEIGRSGAGAPFFNDGYAAANRAVQSLTEVWAREAAPEIRVNELVVGLIEHRHGKGTRGWGALSEKEHAEILQEVLLGRTGTPAEVAEMAYFLTVEASYTTGSVVKMDGGISLGARKVPPMPIGIL